jgi:HK97 family phage major capsid protein
MGSGPDTAVSVTSISSSGTTATLTATAHGCRVGDRIQVLDSTDTDYNGYFHVVSVPTADTLTYTMAADPGDDTADGTILFRNLSIWAGAASVAENALKPESKLLPRSVTGVVELIAHIFRVSKQALDDIIGLQSDINTMGIRGLAELEEYKFLYGPGTSNTITGLLVATGTQSYSQAVTGSVGRFSMMRHGVTMLENVGAMPSAAIINPNDHETFETSVGLDDHWMLPAGSDGGSNQLWRVPLVSTRSIAPGTVLMGDFQEGAYIVDRESPNVSFADQDGDDFKYNRLAVRFEERLGLAIPRPEFFVKLTLTS